MRYNIRSPKRSWPRRILIVAALVALLVGGGTIAVRHTYFQGLKPVSNASETTAKLITIERGASVDQIARQLKDAGLIRSPWAFKLYVKSKEVRDSLQAGTYSFNPSQSVAEIVAQLTHGRVATDLITILPGQRIDQIKTTLINYGYAQADVEHALDPATYEGNPALVDKPAGASLEGYLYPDSYQKDSGTTPQEVVTQALAETNKRLTPDMRAQFAKQGLSAYEAMIVASIVEQEVSNGNDRPQVAQVFIKRYNINMALGSDVTALYGSITAGKGRSLSYDSPYNTRLHTGLPPTPIGNMSQSSLQAVAKPASTDWLYFVAGDDGTTHFTRTLDEHEAPAAQYCKKLCAEP